VAKIGSGPKRPAKVLLGPAKVLLGPALGHLGPVKGRKGPALGRLGPVKVRSCPTLGPKRPAKGPSLFPAAIHGRLSWEIRSGTAYHPRVEGGTTDQNAEKRDNVVP
jgi:hypothetical protein